MSNGALQTFRWVSHAEGTSFLILLGIAMPIKYLVHVPEVVLVVGWAHGVLWMLYMLALLRTWIVCRWPFKLCFWAGVASVVPFGPFVFDRWLRRRTMPPDKRPPSGSAPLERGPETDDPLQRQRS